MDLNEQLRKAKEELLEIQEGSNRIPEEEIEKVEKDIPSDDKSETDNAEGELQPTDDVSDKTEKVEDTKPEGEESGDEIPEGDKQTKASEEKETVEEKEETDTEDLKDNTEVEEKPEEEPSEEKNQDNPPSEEKEVQEIEELKRELEELKIEKDINTSMQQYNDLVVKHKSEFSEFQDLVKQRVHEECVKYGIPMDMDFEEMRIERPDKYNILQHIFNKADEAEHKVLQEIANEEREAVNNIIIKKAGVEMTKYDLTQEQSVETAKTFFEIMNNVGLKDFGEDLKAKVEFAVARAKMIKPSVDKVVEDVKEGIDVTKKTVEDTKEVIKGVKEAVVEAKKLDDFKEGAVVEGTPSKETPVNEENVMAIYNSKKGDDRIAFFKEHKDLILKEHLKSLGM